MFRLGQDMIMACSCFCLDSSCLESSLMLIFSEIVCVQHKNTKTQMLGARLAHNNKASCSRMPRAAFLLLTVTCPRPHRARFEPGSDPNHKHHSLSEFFLSW